MSFFKKIKAKLQEDDDKFDHSYFEEQPKQKEPKKKPNQPVKEEPKIIEKESVPGKI